MSSFRDQFLSIKNDFTEVPSDWNPLQLDCFLFFLVFSATLTSSSSPALTYEFFLFLSFLVDFLAAGSSFWVSP